MSGTIIDFRRPPLIDYEGKMEIADLMGAIIPALCDEKLDEAIDLAERIVRRLKYARALGAPPPAG
jgi:hypothetical protein